MIRIDVGNPINVGKQTICLLADHVIDIENSHLSDQMFSYVQIEQPGGKHKGIYILEEDITSAKVSYEGVVVFGLWQVLLENDLVDLSKEVNIFYKDGEEGSGWFLIANDDCEVVETGEFSQNFVPGYAVNDANVIEPDHDALKLPSKEALTRLEIASRNRFETRKIYIAESVKKSV